jgi:hypothetical protein
LACCFPGGFFAQSHPLRTYPPQVTYFSDLARCTLMEKSSPAEFDLNFYDGAKAAVSSGDECRYVPNSHPARTLCLVEMSLLSPPNNSLPWLVKMEHA